MCCCEEWTINICQKSVELIKNGRRIWYLTTEMCIPKSDVVGTKSQSLRSKTSSVNIFFYRFRPTSSFCYFWYNSHNCSAKTFLSVLHCFFLLCLFFSYFPLAPRLKSANEKIGATCGHFANWIFTFEKKQTLKMFNSLRMNQCHAQAAVCFRVIALISCCNIIIYTPHCSLHRNKINNNKKWTRFQLMVIPVDKHIILIVLPTCAGCHLWFLLK